MNDLNNLNNVNNANNVIVITGPTASGKTALSIELAKKINGEIISADSMQIYKYMDIGTAKPKEIEKQGIKHHMIDIILPDESYNVSRYKNEAEECIQKVLDAGKVPIITGGTGLYINSLVYNINFSETTQNNGIREDLQRTADEMGNEYIYSILKDMDPRAAARLHANNLKRVIRSIEIFKITGKSIIEHEAESRIIPSSYSFRIFCINVQRELLYKRIDARVDLMMEQGLIDEVIMLKNMGYATGATAMQAIGYKEILAYLKGNLTLNEAVETMKQGSRRYAKRQVTWMKKIENVNMIDYDPTHGNSNVLEKIITSVE